jgi:hypothetical protein
MSVDSLEEIIGNFKDTIGYLIEKVETLGISLTDKRIDHVCYRCSSAEEYDYICEKMKLFGNLIIESIVGGRPISTFLLHDPIIFIENISQRSWSIPCIEVPFPKKGSYYKSGIEHMEIVIGTEANQMINSKVCLETFMTLFPQIDFNIKSINKPINADISIELENDKKVKFHTNALYDVCLYEIQNNLVDSNGL